MTTTCPNYDRDYCLAHDYDHVLDRRERNLQPLEQGRQWVRVADRLTAARSTRDLASLPIVDRRHLDRTGAHQVMGEASTMFRGGGTPDAFVVIGRDEAPVLFTWRSADRDAEGEVTAWRFTTDSGCTAVVLND